MNLEKENKEINSEKRKRIIKRTIICVLIILLTIGVIYGGIILTNYLLNKTNGINDLNNILSEYENKSQYSVTATSTENGTSEYYAKLDNSAYIVTQIDGVDEREDLIKDGNTYLIRDEEEAYYKYQNNVTELRKFTNQLGEFENSEYIEGKEKIENKNYEYQEYNGSTDWIYNRDIDKYDENIKTRFYFDDGELVYIKTILGDNQEIVKVEISDDISKATFELPEGYTEK